jgi:hypothetical protein
MIEERTSVTVLLHLARMPCAGDYLHQQSDSACLCLSASASSRSRP